MLTRKVQRKQPGNHTITKLAKRVLKRFKPRVFVSKTILALNKTCQHTHLKSLSRDDDVNEHRVSLITKLCPFQFSQLVRVFKQIV